MLAAMLGAVSPDERIVCVEDAAELAPRHPHLVKLVARRANVEGIGEVTVRQLVRQALRMRPDRIVVGEVRGAEVVDLLAALNTGHEGGAGTVHANNPGEVPARMEALGALGGLDRAALHSQLAAAVQVNWSASSPKLLNRHAMTGSAGRWSRSSGVAVALGHRCLRLPWRRPPLMRCWSISIRGPAASIFWWAAKPPPVCVGPTWRYRVDG